MNPVVRFTLLACGITWLAMLPLVLQTLNVVSLGIPGYWHGAAALGPLTAAFVMRRAGDPRVRVRDLYRRRDAGGAGPGWTAALALSPLLFLGIGLVWAHVVDGSLAWFEPRAWLTDPAWLVELVIVSVLYGLGEEPGWRGWLLPQLQARHSPLRSTLVVAVIWAIWHAPFLVPGLGAAGAVGLIPFFIGILAGAFWLTFLFNSTGGSVLAAALWHAAWNAAIFLARPSATAGGALGTLLVITGLGLAIILGHRGLTAGARPRP